jgi:hypothetical protein
MGMADPFPEEDRMELTLYLTRQVAQFNEDQLGCLFCHRGHDVLWETSFNLGTGTKIISGVCENCRTRLKPKPKPPKPDGFVHVDDFIDDYRADPYARFVLDYFRRSSAALNAFWPFMKDQKLFCTWEGKRMRVTGASRLGDIWLSADHVREVGYEHRVSVATCTEWSRNP